MPQIKQGPLPTEHFETQALPPLFADAKRRPGMWVLPPNKVVIGRDAHCVSVTITCPDVATAMVLYRSLCDDAQEGFVSIDFPVTPRPVIAAD